LPPRSVRLFDNNKTEPERKPPADPLGARLIVKSRPS
jgi:hypothetical protein